MRNHLLLSSISIVLLASCAAQTTPENTATNGSSSAAVTPTSVPTELILGFETDTATGAAMSGMKTYLTLSGAVNQRILVDTIEVNAEGAATMKRLDASVYSANTKIIAAFENYFAGGGRHLVVRRGDNNMYLIQTRPTEEGSEESPGGCPTAWDTVTSLTLPANLAISVSPDIEVAERAVIGCEGW